MSLKLSLNQNSIKMWQNFPPKKSSKGWQFFLKIGNLRIYIYIRICDQKKIAPKPYLLNTSHKL